jgi:hypothetical protein
MVVKMTEIILMIIGGVVGFVVLSPYLARALAKHNLFFTLIKEGEGKVFLRNQAFEKAVIRYKGFRLDGRWNVIESNRREQLTQKEAKAKGSAWDGRKRRKEDKWWNKFFGGGLAYVGIWPFDTVHTYKFRWEAQKEGKPVAHDELLDYVFVKSSVYYTKLEGAETFGMVPLDIGLNLTIRVTNPYRALFRAHQWLEFAVSRLAPYIRQYIPATKKEFKELIGVQQGPDSELFKFLGTSKEKFTVEQKRQLREQGHSEREIEDMELAGKGILWVLREIYGVDIQGIEFASITTVGKEYETAAAKEWSAEQEKKQKVILAEGEAQAIDTITAAKKRRIEELSSAIEKHGEVGLFYKMTETIEEGSKGPSNWILSIDALQNIISRILTGKKKGGDKK